MSELMEVLNIKTEEFKRKSYEELFAYTNTANCFGEKYKGRKYYFEVEAHPIKDGLKISVECSVRKFIFWFCGRQKYFTVLKNGQVKDINGSDFW